MRVRLEDIAEELGLSVVTVSKAMRDYRDVSPVTKRRVLRKSRELGYEPNWVARSLVTRRSHIIGMVLPHLRHSFFQEAYEAIVQEVAPREYTVLIGVSLNDPESEEREIRQFQSRQADGLLLASARPPSNPGYIRGLAGGSTPTVLLDRSFDDLEMNFVGVDDRALAKIAVEHLIAQGRRRIAHLHGPDLSTSRLRLDGYREALRKNGLPFDKRLVGQAFSVDPDSERAIERLLSFRPGPDAVFCYNDPVAASVMRVALRKGLRIPEDLAIVGAGAMRYSDLFYKPLTTIDQRSREVGAAAAKLLLSLIEAKRRRKPRRILVAPALVVRASSGA